MQLVGIVKQIVEFVLLLLDAGRVKVDGILVTGIADAADVVGLQDDFWSLGVPAFLSSIREEDVVLHRHRRVGGVLAGVQDDRHQVHALKVPLRPGSGTLASVASVGIRSTSEARALVCTGCGKRTGLLTTRGTLSISS